MTKEARNINIVSFVSPMEQFYILNIRQIYTFDNKTSVLGKISITSSFLCKIRNVSEYSFRFLFVRIFQKNKFRHSETNVQFRSAIIKRILKCECLGLVSCLSCKVSKSTRQKFLELKRVLFDAIKYHLNMHIYLDT